MFCITSLTIISLIGTTVIEYGSTSYTKEDATAECENLMDGYLFETEITSGATNFKTSYFEITSNMIESHFNQTQEDEEPNEKTKRELQRELFSRYFLDLNMNHDIVFDMKSIKDWCKQKVLDERRYTGVYMENLLNIQAKDCENAIKRHFDIDESKTPLQIFNLFYDEWTIDAVRKESDNDVYSVMIFNDEYFNKTTFHINGPQLNYPKSFFEYYGKKVLEPVLTKGFFRSIYEFCDVIGYKIVSEKANS